MAFGADRQLHPKHKFLVESNRFGFSKFQKSSELSHEIAKIEYWEGGALIPIKIPGRITVTDVTLERGSSNRIDFHQWCLYVADASKGGPDGMIGGKGHKSPLFKDDVAITSRDLDNTVLREWTLLGAFPIKYVAGDWDNTVDEVVIETLTLTYDYPRMSRTTGVAKQP